MKPENKAILDKHRPIYVVLMRAFYLKGLNHHELDELIRVMREEFSPGYTTDFWCPPCLSDFIKAIYWHYDKWIAAQPKVLPQPAQEQPIIMDATFPVNDPPVAVPPAEHTGISDQLFIEEAGEVNQKAYDNLLKPIKKNHRR